MDLSRRALLKSGSITGTAGLLAGLFDLNPITRAIAQGTPDPTASASVDLSTFTGKLPHATHYGPCIATLVDGRIKPRDAVTECDDGCGAAENTC